MYSFKDEKFVYLGQRSTIYEYIKGNVIVLYNEGILFRLDWATMRAYFLVDLGTSARMTFLIRKDNIYLTREEPCYYA
jgi:hypothetical protein